MRYASDVLSQLWRGARDVICPCVGEWLGGVPRDVRLVAALSASYANPALATATVPEVRRVSGSLLVF